MNYREKNVKNTNTWRLNTTLLNNHEITEEIKEEIKKYLETNDNENTPESAAQNFPFCIRLCQISSTTALFSSSVTAISSISTVYTR